jgi:hypothetical protein
LYATDDWAVGMAQLIKANLNPKLYVYYEFCNEDWNWGFGQWQVVENWDQTNSALTIGPGWQRHGQEVAFLLMHFANIMQPIIGSQGRPILAGQFGDAVDYCGAGLAWIQQTYGPPSQYIWGISGAAYFTDNGNETDVDTIFANMTAYFSSVFVPCLQQNVALANQYNVKFTCYESGQGLAYSDASSAAQQDPRMATAYQTMTNLLINSGTDLCCFFNFIGGWGQYGYWGALTDVRELPNNPTVKYTAEAQIALNGRPSCNCSTTSSTTSSTHNTWTQQEAQKNAAKAAAQAAAAASKQHNTGMPQQSSGTSHMMSKEQMAIWAQQEAAKNEAKAAAEQAAEAKKKH